MGTNYAAGRRFEWTMRTELQKDSYVVARTAGSKSVVDLIAWKGHELVFMQCKKGAKPCIPKTPPVPVGLLTARYELVWQPKGGGLADIQVLRTFSQGTP